MPAGGFPGRSAGAGMAGGGGRRSVWPSPCPWPMCLPARPSTGCSRCWAPGTPSRRTWPSWLASGPTSYWRPTFGCAPPPSCAGATGWSPTRRWISGGVCADAMSVNDEFTTVRSEGRLLPPDLLHRIASGDQELEGLAAKDYGLPASNRLGEAAARAWARARPTGPPSRPPGRTCPRRKRASPRTAVAAPPAA